MLMGLEMDLFSFLTFYNIITLLYNKKGVPLKM
jgi:hypothetical protein